MMGPDWTCDTERKTGVCKMKQYVIDQLRESDYDGILGYLEKHAEKTMLEGVFRVDLPRDLCTGIQLEHASCRPHYFAVNVNPKQAAFELLIRSRQIIRCSCIGYETREQRDYILAFADNMLDELGIKL